MEPYKTALYGWYPVFSCGCSGPGYIPADKNELIAYFNAIIAQYHKELDFWRNRIEPVTKPEKSREQALFGYHLHMVPTPGRKKTVATNQEAIRYWITKIKEVETKIALIR